MYKSKLSLETYLTTLFALLFLFSAIFCFTHLEIALEGRIPGKTTPLVILGFISILLFAAIIFPVVKRTSIITVSNDHITFQYLFKRLNFPKEQVKSIELLARKTATLFDPEYILNGLGIISIDDKAYFLPDKYIGSKSLLKQKLETFCKMNNVELISFPASESQINISHTLSRQKFSGNYLTSMNGIICIAVIAFTWASPLWMIPNRMGDSAYVFFLVFSACCLAFNSIPANFFVGENNKLIVKNHLAFLKNKEFDLEDIRCATFEERKKVSVSLRIVFKDYSSKRYFAGSLRKRHWEALRDYLEGNNIPVVADNLF